MLATFLATSVVLVLTQTSDDHKPSPDDSAPPKRVAASELIERIHDAHGHVGPWAVVGYRMGQHAMEAFQLPRHSRAIDVVHHTPMEFKFTCAADGVMAITGATPGKMNIRLEPCAIKDLHTVITDRYTGRVLTFRLRPERAQELAGVTPEQLDAMSLRFAGLDDDAIFTVEESHVPPTLDRSKERILP
jgi:hypothetical protein